MFNRAKYRWTMAIEGDQGLEMRILNMLDETAKFTVRDTIKAIKELEAEMDRKRKLLTEKCQDYVIEDYINEMLKEGKQKHFFNKEYKVRVDHN